MKQALFAFLFLSLSACSTLKPQPNSSKVERVLDQAERDASPEGRKILVLSRSMIADQEVIKGGCWDYINTVYNRAGYPIKDRINVFKSKIKGPFVDLADIRPGDWLYYINHSYNKIDHSGVFVAWVNFETKIGLIMSYAGEKRKTPARYQNYDLSNVYTIIRASPLK